MIKASHSKLCSRRIAFQESLYLGRFSRFAILNPEEEKAFKKKIGVKAIDTQMDYGPVAGGLGIVTFITNLTFFMQLDGGDTSAIIYPILFTLIITASTSILVLIKGRKMIALALSLSNICFTSAFFMLYILIIAFSLMK